MTLSSTTTLVEYFYHWEKTTPDKVFLRQPFGNTWTDFTWREAGQQARKLATYLQSLGLPRGSHIGLVSKNCAEWLISDIAIMLSGHVSVPFYPTLVADQLKPILVHSDCKLLLVGKLDNWPAMKTGYQRICRASPSQLTTPTQPIRSGTTLWPISRL